MASLNHRVLIQAPAEDVYRLLTTGAGLSGWWTKSEARPEVGSIARFEFGPSYRKEMRITELVPSRRVGWMCIAGTDEWVGTTIHFELECRDSGAMVAAHPEIGGQAEHMGQADEVTLLIFHHDGWKTGSPMFAECNYTWALFLRSLKLLCETGTGRPSPLLHRV